MKFRLNGGIHQDDTGTVYRNGDTVENDADLASMFPGKFARIQDTPSAVVQTTTVPSTGETGPEQPVSPPLSEDVVADTSKFGEDTTNQFPEFVEYGLRVFKDKGKYNVYDATNWAGPLNDKPLTKVGVGAFLDGLEADE